MAHDAQGSTITEIPSVNPASTSAGRYALVAVDRAQSHIERELTYGVPSELRFIMQPGFAVLVPLGRQAVTGYVTGFTDTLDFNPRYLRSIVRLVSRAPLSPTS